MFSVLLIITDGEQPFEDKIALSSPLVSMQGFGRYGVSYLLSLGILYPLSMSSHSLKFPADALRFGWLSAF